MPIDNGDICAAPSVFQTQLINNKSICTRMMSAQHFAMEALPNLSLIHSQYLNADDQLVLADCVYSQCDLPR